MMMKKTVSILFAALLPLSLLAGCGGANTGTPASDPTPAPATVAPSSPVPAGTPAPTEAPAPAETPAESGGKVAGAEDMTTVEDVVEPGMVPVYADSLKDGVYPVEMKSSSSMFKADHCELEVLAGKMVVILYMSSDSYSYMYAGTAAEAAAQMDKAFYCLPTDGTFTLPLNALDSGEHFAAYSKRKELWYDRTLLFRADSLPVEAFQDGFFTTVESLGLADGLYYAEVSLSGGSGKAKVTSPARMDVTDGVGWAEIIWSSPNYDYMKVDGEQYLPISGEGADVSAFVIPVAYFDRPMTVYADTTAMSQPHEIEYTLTFDSSTIQGMPFEQ